MDLLRLDEPLSLQADTAAVRQTLLPLLDGLCRAFGYSRALVALYDERRRCLRGTVGLNLPAELVESLEVSADDRHHPFVASLFTGRPARVNDVPRDTEMDEHDRALLVDLGITSFVAVPLQRESAGLPERVAGPTGGQAGPEQGRPSPTGRARQVRRPAGPTALGVAVLGKEAAITDEDVEWLMPFATQAGATIAHAHEVELLRDSNEQSAIENEWLWRMVDSVADPIVVTDEQNDIIRQNRPAERIFRSAQEDSEGKRNAIRMNNFLFTAALSTARLGPAVTDEGREIVLVDPIEGSELVYEMICRPAHHFRLNATGTVSVLKNIGDLRDATAELTENIQRLQTADDQVRLERDRLNLVLRNVPNPIVVLDNANQITQMNQEAERLFQPVPVVASPDRKERSAALNNARFASFVSQLRLDATAGHGELALSDPDTDETLAMSVSSTELRDERGGLIGNVTVMQDLTRLRELERRRVEQQLFESEKLAATGRLAASIAHEINNPLEAIKNSLYLLVRRMPDDDTSRQFLEIAMKETERVSRILRQMLGFYRPTVSTGPTDVNVLIQEAEALIGKDLRQKGVYLHHALSPGLPVINASADQLKQVLLNLLLNAQEALPDGGDVYVSTHLADDAASEFLPSHAVLIQVRDTGKGIPDDQLGSIFEPFFSTKSEQKGTGLGLWVSQGIVHQHGGSIKVRSRLGQGTTFTIALPLEGPASNG